jgi:micrococcal nuclease
MYEYKAVVDRVIDGDTVDFIVDLGFSVFLKIRGRLADVDTPERGHKDWHLATDTCKGLLEKAKGGKKGEIIIKTNKTGKYGRWIVQIEGVTDELAKIWPYNFKG